VLSLIELDQFIGGKRIRASPSGFVLVLISLLLFFFIAAVVVPEFRRDPAEFFRDPAEFLRDADKTDVAVSDDSVMTPLNLELRRYHTIIYMYAFIIYFCV